MVMTSQAHVAMSHSNFAWVSLTIQLVSTLCNNWHTDACLMFIICDNISNTTA